MRKFSLHFVSRISTVFIFWLVSCPLIGQVLPKKDLKPSEYDQWGTLRFGGMSRDGMWVSYLMTYENGNDTLFLKKTRGKALHEFPKGIEGKFGKGTFACLSKENVVSLVNLKTGMKQHYKNVTEYEFSDDGKYLVVAKRDVNDLYRLEIADAHGMTVLTIGSVSNYAWDNGKSAVVYTTKNGDKYAVGILNLIKKLENRVIATGNGAALQPTFSRNAEAVAYYATKDSTDEVHCFNLKLNRLFTFSGKSDECDLTLDTRENYPLKISDDGQKVFFGVRSNVKRDTSFLNEVAEVWYANDRKIYPLRRDIASIPAAQLLYMWEPETNQLLKVTPDGEKLIIFTGKQRFAITGDQRPYLLQQKFIYDMDCYITNINSGERRLLVKQQTGNLSGVAVSIEGRYVSYYRERDWFVYNADTDMHVNITQGLGISWDDSDKDPVTDTRIYGCAGFSTNGNILIYDEYDIWEISIDGLKRKRLTNGRENFVRYRFDAEAANIDERFYFHIGPVVFDLNRHKLLTARDLHNGGSGYSVLDQGKATKLVGGRRNVSKLEMVSGSEFAYVSESFSVPPSIKYSGKDAKEITVFQSNPHYKKYQWGTSEMIHYEANGRSLNGALYYPAGFDASKKYPMVVYIYEGTVSWDAYRYKNPSMYDSLGFNVTNFTLNGYIVLMPDIAYGAGQTGIDATICVSAAVDKVFKMGFVDARKIGLIGHSFGGYETNFIITNTSLFAAAVSGSAVSDNIAHYFTINSNNERAEGWRYERQQYRMGKSLYEMQSNYIRNSPVLQAASITTPLLSWAGGQDKNVKPEQSLIFYMALRRLGKKHIRLVYPDAGHIFDNKKDQFDLTNRIQDWFDYFLKEKKDIDWISKEMKDLN